MRLFHISLDYPKYDRCHLFIMDFGEQSVIRGTRKAELAGVIRIAMQRAGPKSSFRVRDHPLVLMFYPKTTLPQPHWTDLGRQAIICRISSPQRIGIVERWKTLTAMFWVMPLRVPFSIFKQYKNEQSDHQNRQLTTW